MSLDITERFLPNLYKSNSQLAAKFFILSNLDRTGYKLEDALTALSSQDLTEEEIRALKENMAGPELIRVSRLHQSLQSSYLFFELKRLQGKSRW